MVSFVEYLVFFRAVFCTEQLQMICKMSFDMFFGILIFNPMGARASYPLVHSSGPLEFTQASLDAAPPRFQATAIA